MFPTLPPRGREHTAAGPPRTVELTCSKEHARSRSHGAAAIGGRWGGGGAAAPPRARRASGGHRYFLGIDSALGRELTERPAQSSAFLKSCKMLTRMQGNLCFSGLS